MLLKRMRSALCSLILCASFAQSGWAIDGAASVWERVSAMEKQKAFSTIKVDSSINISSSDIKSRYGEPTKIGHYKLGHPPTTGTIWTYKRPDGDLEFRFFLDTKHVNQIELKRRSS